MTIDPTKPIQTTDGKPRRLVGVFDPPVNPGTGTGLRPWKYVAQDLTGMIFYDACGEGAYETIINVPEKVEVEWWVLVTKDRGIVHHYLYPSKETAMQGMGDAFIAVRVTGTYER